MSRMKKPPCALSKVSCSLHNGIAFFGNWRLLLVSLPTMVISIHCHKHCSSSQHPVYRISTREMSYGILASLTQITAAPSIMSNAISCCVRLLQPSDVSRRARWSMLKNWSTNGKTDVLNSLSHNEPYSCAASIQLFLLTVPIFPLRSLASVPTTSVHFCAETTRGRKSLSRYRALSQRSPNWLSNPP